jgi:hypothetical protein
MKSAAPLGMLGIPFGILGMLGMLGMFGICPLLKH